MPAAIPVPVRQLLVERIARGEPVAAVAADLGLPFWTARTLWRRYRERGADGLAPRACCAGGIRRGARPPSARSWSRATPPSRCPTSARSAAGSPRRG